VVDLEEWLVGSCTVFERASLEVDISPTEKSDTLRFWASSSLCSALLCSALLFCSVAPQSSLHSIHKLHAGVLRDYANSRICDEEKTDKLFQLAFEKYQQEVDMFGEGSSDYLVLEYWAFAIREHANFYSRTNNLAKAKERFDDCLSKYAECAAIHTDVVVLGNWAGYYSLHVDLLLPPSSPFSLPALPPLDALRERADLADDEEEKEHFFQRAHEMYKVRPCLLSFSLFI